MTTYREKLLDPRWQRRRLEKLGSVGFACEACAATDRTLHVHHPRYIKGREPWEYANDELQVLCVDCHAEHHEREAAVSEVLRSVFADDLVAVSAGYFYSAGVSSEFDSLMRVVKYPRDFWAGYVGYRFVSLPDESRRQVLELILAHPPKRYTEERWGETADLLRRYFG